MPIDPDPNLRLTGRHHTQPQTDPAMIVGGEGGAAEQPDQAAAQRRRMRRSMLLRLLVLLLSAGGVLGAIWLWLIGRGSLGVRVLAGDILVLVLVVLFL